MWKAGIHRFHVQPIGRILGRRRCRPRWMARAIDPLVTLARISGPKTRDRRSFNILRAPDGLIPGGGWLCMFHDLFGILAGDNETMHSILCAVSVYYIHISIIERQRFYDCISLGLSWNSIPYTDRVLVYARGRFLVRYKYVVVSLSSNK